MSVRAKKILITGGEGGLGSVIAKGLRKLGGSVASADKVGNPNFEGDITDQEFINHIAKASAWDVLINCAGVGHKHPLFEYPEDKWDETIATNLTAPFRLCREVAERMVDNGIRGSIINITSLNTVQAFEDNPAYIASKGGLRTLTKSLARDLGPHGIRVNNIVPGWIKTELTKPSQQSRKEEVINRTMLGRWGEPEDLIGPAVFLASDMSAYVTGTDLVVDGGWLSKG